MTDAAETIQPGADPKPFVHLHVHTEFSLLDGLSKIDKLVARAKAQGMTSLAITDHGTMHGVIQFYRACRAANIKPIIGMESYLARRDRTIHDQSEKQPYHLLLLARNQTGYRNLLKLASEAQLTGFYGKPRVDKDLLARYSEGIICTSGCLAAEIPRMFAEDREADAQRLIGEYQDIFGAENFFLELQAHDIPELRKLNEWLTRYRGGANVPLLATNDVHYIMADDFDAHDTLLCIQTGARKDEVKRMRMTDPSYHLRSADEMWALFGDVAPEALTNTQIVADMCDLDLENKDYHLPLFPVPEVHSSGTYLRQLALRGARWRYGAEADSEVVSTRIEYELNIISTMGFETYFLIVWDLCQYARNAGIWWNVRGSGAGSVVAYSLGITSIDPIRNNLIFERFLNPGRVTMPDIDMDFPDDQRARMIDYAVRKYGEEKVAAIITFGTLKARAAIKDVARTLGYPLERANALTQMVPNIPSHPVTLAQCLGDDPEYMVADLKNAYAADQETRTVLDTALRVEGVARSAGTHAAGVIISDKPLVNYLPLHRPTSNASEAVPIKRVTQFPMEICESIGLLKIDFLGLSTLSVMRRACELIARYQGVRYDLSNIPYRPVPDDPQLSQMVEQAFDLIGSGEVTGVFQLESQGMRRMLVEMQPKTFEHIVAAISLYRPGPLQFIPMFNKRLHGEEPVEYLHPKLEPILGETYGIIAYQEQLMRIGSDLFGYSLGEADLMRRAVSKKKLKDLIKHKEVFIAKGPENGVPAEIAEKIFDQVEYFAAYGFNKCLIGTTEIIDAATGRLVRIGDLAVGTTHIEQTITCDTDHLKLQAGQVEAVHENGIKPVYRLRTQLGRQIEATGNHPFYTFDGWKMLDDLAVGGQIAVPRRLPVEGKNEWPEVDIIAAADRVKYGIDQAIPSEVFSLTNAQIALFVAHLVDIDGQIVVSSERLGQQIQHLYLRLGQTMVLRCGEIVTISTLHTADTSLSWQLTPVPLAEAADNTSDIYWDRITAIEYIGEQMTYDLAIPGTHNFIANDILVHNSHAADYAVITCQTAFLKCHYAPEYYTALLTVQRDKIEDVTLFTADCRRLGIPILPPNINYSELDFTIEDQDGKRGIRFGLGAIKGVGDKASEMIIAERAAHGPYVTLSDFSSRLDLSAMGGKRPLEALTKVGVFDAFGERHLILAALDRMVGMSKAQHNARKTGQSLMFDTAAADSQSDTELLKGLHNVQEVTQREKLDWEKELIGLYVSSHPLDPFMAYVASLPNLTYSSQMKEDAETIHDRPVTLVGMASAIRRVVTKKNETMAIVTVDDLFGSFDAVFFPRTWARFAETIKENEPYIFRGKADTKRGSPQVLIDSITQEFDLNTSADNDPYYYDVNPPHRADSHPDSRPNQDDQPVAVDYPPPSYEAYESAADAASRPPTVSSSPANGYNNGNGSAQPVNAPAPAVTVWADDDDNEDQPPPPRQLRIAFAAFHEGKRDQWQRRIERIYRELTQLPGSDELTFRIPDPDSGVAQLMTFAIGIDYDQAVSYLASMKAADKAEITWTDLKN